MKLTDAEPKPPAATMQTCPDCRGEGRTVKTTEIGGRRTLMRLRCDGCKGRGYIWK